ncbi:MAG: T9SS type A sorting domain-containing protein [Chitinophagales bacterium]|nr:T9SS type A sorting domain-containing protein [Chitinophagales bacterium]
MKKTILYSLLQLLIFQKMSAQVWRPLGEGINNAVFAMCVDSINNQLYVGGRFNQAGNLTVQNLATWDGSNWHKAPTMQDEVNALIYFNGRVYIALDNGVVGYIKDNIFVVAGSFDNDVSCFAIYKGALYAGGHFEMAYGFYGEKDREVNHIARMDTIGRWLPLGDGINGSEVEAMHEYNGDLIAGGFFNTAGDNPVKNIARWDGKKWHPMKTGLYDPDNENSAYVDAMDTFQNELVVGGEFHQAGSIPCHSIATWSNNTWDTLDYVSTNSVRTIYSAFGNLYVSGIIDDGLSAWNGVNWYQLNWGGEGDIFSFSTYQGHLYAGGIFYQLMDSLNSIAYLDYGNSVTECFSPYAGKSNDITATSASLSWKDSSTTPTGYRVYYKVKNTTGWQKAHSPTKSKTLKGLSAGTTYSWMVGSKCDTAHSDFSERYEFTTLAEKKSLSEDDSPFNFSIRPNPGDGQVNITVTSNNSIPIILKIYDMTGRVVYSDGWVNGGSDDKFLNLSTLQPGVYSMQLLCNNHEAIRKLVMVNR